MSGRTLLTLIILFIILNAGLFFFLQKDTLLNKTPSIPSDFTQSGSQAGIVAPVDLGKSGIESASLLYNFRGKVEGITNIEDNINIKLDISDSQTPVFLTTGTTFVVIIKKGTETPVRGTFEDVQIGSDVTLVMLYDLDKKTWEMASIQIYQ